MIDIAYFPHVFDEIVDELYRMRAVDTLLTLRKTSPAVQDIIDGKLASHLVVRGKGHDMCVSTRWGRLQLSSHGVTRARVVDVHHFNFHPVCNFNAKRRDFESCEAEDAIASYVNASAPDTVRLFDSKGFTGDACGASTVVHFTEAYYFFSSGVKVKLVPNVNNVINIRYGDNVGLFEVLWGDQDVCMESVHQHHQHPASPARDVVILFTPKSAAATTQDPLENPDQKRGLLNSLVVSAISYLHRHPNAHLKLVGTEKWSEHWFQLWPIQQTPDAHLAHNLEYLWDLVFLHYARMGWTCGPHYAQKTKCTPLNDDEILRLQKRISIVSEEDYKECVGADTFSLYSVE